MRGLLVLIGENIRQDFVPAIGAPVGRTLVTRAGETRHIEARGWRDGHFPGPRRELHRIVGWHYFRESAPLIGRNRSASAGSWPGRATCAEDRFLIYEAQWVPEGVCNIERALAPRPGFYPRRYAIITCPCFGCAGIRSFEVIGRDVQVIRIRSGIEGVTVGPRIEGGQHYVSAEEIVTTE